MRDATLQRIKERLEPEHLKDEQEIAKVWTDKAAKPPSQAAYEASVGKAWRDAACATEGMPYVAEALVNQLALYSVFSKDSPEPAKLAASFVAPACSGARSLSDETIAALRDLAETTSPPAPRPLPSKASPEAGGGPARQRIQIMR